MDLIADPRSVTSHNSASPAASRLVHGRNAYYSLSALARCRSRRGKGG